ncbi:MAG TPA: hypothetical protein PK252_05405 [Bacteroidales bacterium]|nr:hypothetical protein [Bacteroidales bacterium]
MYTIKPLCLLVFAITLISCEYEPKGSFYQEIDKDIKNPEVETRSLTFNKDTIVIEEGNLLGYSFFNADKKIRRILFKIDGQVFVDASTFSGSFSLKGVSKGIHELEAVFMLNSGTGSIMDKLGGELYATKKTWVLVVLKAHSETINATSENGFLKIYWDTCYDFDFQYFEIFKGPTLIGKTKLPFYVDSSYIGESVTYTINANRANSSTIWCSKDFKELHYDFLFISDHKRCVIKWNRPICYNAIEKTIIYINNSTFETTDTSIILPVTENGQRFYFREWEVSPKYGNNKYRVFEPNTLYFYSSYKFCQSDIVNLLKIDESNFLYSSSSDKDFFEYSINDKALIASQHYLDEIKLVSQSNKCIYGKLNGQDAIQSLDGNQNLLMIDGSPNIIALSDYSFIRYDLDGCYLVKFGDENKVFLSQNYLENCQMSFDGKYIMFSEGGLLKINKIENDRLILKGSFENNDVRFVRFGFKYPSYLYYWNGKRFLVKNCYNFALSSDILLNTPNTEILDINEQKNCILVKVNSSIHIINYTNGQILVNMELGDDARYEKLILMDNAIVSEGGYIYHVNY